MAVNTKEIQDRLKSIKNTKKITKAMEMVAAAKMRKAVNAAQETRTYYALVSAIVNRLHYRHHIDQHTGLHKFFDKPKDNARTHIVVFSSNRGLCGAFNSHIAQAVKKYADKHPDEKISIISVGKKAIPLLSAAGLDTEHAYTKDDGAKTDKSIMNIAHSLHRDFRKGDIDKVLVAYTEYVSAVEQNAIVQQLYPLTIVSKIGQSIEKLPHKNNTETLEESQYSYEPHAAGVLSYLIPRLAEVQIYQALLESNASEHSARMVAMKNATDAATDMGDELVLQYNRARQAAITQEIAEISAGAESMA